MFCLAVVQLYSGGRGNYNDMESPVITTQVTIPKDVSELLYACNVILKQNQHLTPIAAILSWQGQSLVKGVRGSNRFAMSLEHQLKLMSPCKVLKTAS